MDMEQISEKLFKAVCDIIAEMGDGRLVTKTVVIFESLDVDANRCVGVIPSSNVADWETIGLLGYGDAYIRGHIMGMDEEDDYS